MIAEVVALHRYPVKGLSPEAMAEAKLESGGHWPGDRLFALENGPSGFDPAAAEHLPKIRFLMLMRNARLAKLRTSYEDASGVLTIRQGGHVVASGALGTVEGRRAIETMLAAFMGDELRGPPVVLSAPPGFRFMDSRSGFLSLLNLASVAAIAEAAGRKALDPLRFRANVHLAGLPAWGEFDLVGERVRLGSAVLEVIKRIDRCAATDVDPVLGVRDLQVVPLLERVFDHHDCGVYARVIEGGVVRPGDRLERLG
jgi:uncharacterized protein